MANNFSTDSNCVALYKFESGALSSDSRSTNTLTDNNTVQTSTGDYKEGSACADLERDNTEYFSITDANLATGFPLKNGDTTKNISLCAWFKLETALADEDEAAIISKYDSGAGQRSVNLELYNTTGIGHRVHFVLGYNSGASVESHIHATVLSASTWYHVTASYQNSDKAVAIRVRDTSGNTVGSDYTATATLDVNKLFVGTAPIQIGSRNVTPIILWDGLLDEIVIFRDIISSSEATLIALGTYMNIDQEGFRFRNDDGSEAAATWKAAQNTNINLAADTAFRLRELLDATGDPASIIPQQDYRYKRSGGSFGHWRQVK